MKRQVFVSYAHDDEPDGSGVSWLTYVMSHLAQYGENAEIQSWADTNLNGGQDWKARIKAALDTCDIFVLLVSRHSLMSRFIMETEVQQILERQKSSGSTEYPLIFPILITPCSSKRSHTWLRLTNVRPTNGRALSDFEMTSGRNDRDPVMAEIAREIHEAARTIAPPVRISEGPKDRPSGKQKVPKTPIPLDPGFAELVSGKLAIASAGQMPPSEKLEAVATRDLLLSVVVSSPASTEIEGCELIFRIRDVHVRYKVEGAQLDMHDVSALVEQKGFRATRFAPGKGFAAGLTISAIDAVDGVSGALFPDDWVRIGELRQEKAEGVIRASGDIVITPAQIDFIGDVAPAGRKLPEPERESYESMVKALAKRVLEKHASDPAKPFWPLEGDEK